MKYSIAILCCLLLGACALSGSQSETSGIDGTVMAGPMCAAVSSTNPCPDLPFAASFSVLDGAENQVATFESDKQGHFLIMLPPGTYTIVPEASAPILNPETQRKVVNVISAQVAQVTLHFETGIR